MRSKVLIFNLFLIFFLCHGSVEISFAEKGTGYRVELQQEILPDWKSANIFTITKNKDGSWGKGGDLNDTKAERVYIDINKKTILVLCGDMPVNEKGNSACWGGLLGNNSRKYGYNLCTSNLKKIDKMRTFGNQVFGLGTLVNGVFGTTVYAVELDKAAVWKAVKSADLINEAKRNDEKRKDAEKKEWVRRYILHTVKIFGFSKS